MYDQLNARKILRQSAPSFLVCLCVLFGFFSPAIGKESPNAFITVFAGEDRFLLRRADIQRKPVSIISGGTRGAQVYFCIRQRSFDRLLDTIQTSKANTVRLRLGDGAFINIPSSRFKDNCNVWGPFEEHIAEKIRTYLTNASDNLQFFSGPSLISNEFCPEQLFVDICLRPEDPVQEFSELSEAGKVDVKILGPENILITSPAEFRE